MLSRAARFLQCDACSSTCACTPSSPSSTAPTASTKSSRRRRRDHQPALAITDLNNLFGAIKFYKAARGAGVKPMIGAEVLLQGLGKDAAVLSRMVVLVQNKQGYLNLCELLARAWTQNVVKAQAVCKLEWLRELARA